MFRRCAALTLAPAVLLALSIVAPEAAAAESHAFGVRDLVGMDRISDPRVSPDGTRIAFVVSELDLDANRRRTDLWLVGADGSGLRRLTAHEAGDSDPRWTADGKEIWFLSTRSGSSQVWRIAADGGEARRVTDFPLDVASLTLSPDGSKLAFSADVFPDCDGIECTKKRLDDVAGRKTTGKIYDQLMVRHWDTWSDGRRSHLFVMPMSGGTPVDVTKGMVADAPSKPFGGAEELAFTRDGRSLVFTARDVGREEAWSTDLDLWVAPVDGSSAPRCLTDPNRATDTLPLFSPDGKILAYLAMSRPGFEADRNRIVLRPWPEGKERILAESWDRSPGALAWSADGKTIWAIAENVGRSPLFAIDVATGKVREVVPGGTVRSIGIAGDRIVYGVDGILTPVELWSVRPDGTDARALTRINAAKVESARMGQPEQFSFPGWNDEIVHAWVVKPVDFDAKKKYPIAFLIHGGPQGSFGDDFHYRWNPQTYAGAGYAAVMVDFHGSTGYGQAFTDSIRGDWGGKPLEDLRRGLSAALARYPWMDGDRACALGASYGAYMINWMNGNWSDQFRCFVSHDGNLDERMAYFDTEELWFPEWEHHGTPWENPEAYTRHNPIDHVAKWKTPTLVVHGGQDFRVVDTQGLSVFTALQRRGVPSRLLYFPDENHWVLKPKNSILWHETVLEWLDRWTKRTP